MMSGDAAPRCRVCKKHSTSLCCQAGHAVTAELLNSKQIAVPACTVHMHGL